jgi:hypothetical protein
VCAQILACLPPNRSFRSRSSHTTKNKTWHYYICVLGKLGTTILATTCVLIYYYLLQAYQNEFAQQMKHVSAAVEEARRAIECGYVSSHHYMCPHTTTCVSSYNYMCVLIPLHMCPHTTRAIECGYLHQAHSYI